MISINELWNFTKGKEKYLIMKYKSIKLATIGASILFFASCSGIGFVQRNNVSPMYTLYTGIEFNGEEELLLKASGNSYVYSSKWAGTEIGIWKRRKDSLFLFPQMHVYENHCEKYNGFLPEYSIDSSLVGYSIPYRLYISCGKDEIKDYTLEHYHLENKEFVFCVISREPLSNRNIKATKKEKKTMEMRRSLGGEFF